jgi:uncharacterized membrane protein
MWRTDTNRRWHVRVVHKCHAREMVPADEMARLLDMDPRPGQIEIDHDKVSNRALDDLVQLGEDVSPENREALARALRRVISKMQARLDKLTGAADE